MDFISFKEQVHKAKDNYIGLLKFAANILPFVILNICICIDTHLLLPPQR